MDNDLRQMLDLFPKSSDLIHEHYRDDDEFRSMCRDYADALHGIKTWQQSDKAEAPKRVSCPKLPDCPRDLWPRGLPRSQRASC